MERTAGNKEKGGLYSKINISLQTANKLVIILLIALIGVSGYIVMNNGFTIQFDSMGGTSVESQKRMYNDTLVVEDPTREGYEFGGWYQDQDCTIPFDCQTDKITQSMTLYARWIEN